MAQSLAYANSSYLNDCDLSDHSEKIFDNICKQNLPQIEDETPPPGFYEVLIYTNEVEEELAPQKCDSGQHLGDGDAKHMTEQHKVPEPEPGAERGPEAEPDPELSMDTQTQQTQTDVRELRSFCSVRSVQERIRVLRERSAWSLLKMLLLLVSLLHSSYMLCNYATRSSILQRLLISMQPEAIPPPPPRSRPLPVFIWVQLCRLARKLHLIWGWVRSCVAAVNLH